jgi:fatty acid elongase 3
MTTTEAMVMDVAHQVLGKVEQVLHVWDPLVDAVAENDEWRAALMDWRWPLVGAAIYITLLAILRSACKVGGLIGPFDLRWAVTIHNFILCALSFVMATMTTWEGVRAWRADRSFEDHYCDASRDGQLGIHGLEPTSPDRMLTGRVWVWCVVFYLSKYYEFVDTILLALRGRPLHFLHVYHHIIIVPLVLAFIQAEIFYFWVGVVFNSTIHTIMYYYYCMTSLGFEIWWKKHITKLQIFQFCWGIFTWWPFPVVCGYAWNAFTQAPMFVFWFNQAVLLSFLFLFVRFYFRTYSSSSAAAAGKGKAAHGKAKANKARTPSTQKGRRKVE